MSIDLDTLSAAVTVYRNRKSGVYEVQPMRSRGRFGLAESGPAVMVPGTDRAALVEGVTAALDAFGSDQAGASGSAPRPAAHAKFIRDHDAIMIMRLRGGRLDVVPWEHFRGGFKAISALAVVLEPPQTHEGLAAAIKQAFERAG